MLIEIHFQIFLMRKSRCMYDVHGNDVENCANSNADNKSYQVSEKQDKSKETIAPKWINKKFFGKKQKKEEKVRMTDNFQFLGFCSGFSGLTKSSKDSFIFSLK